MSSTARSAEDWSSELRQEVGLNEKQKADHEFQGDLEREKNKLVEYSVTEFPFSMRTFLPKKKKTFLRRAHLNAGERAELEPAKAAEASCLVAKVADRADLLLDLQVQRSAKGDVLKLKLHAVHRDRHRVGENTRNQHDRDVHAEHQEKQTDLQSKISENCTERHLCEVTIGKWLK